MSDQTTLGREVAKALVSAGKVSQEDMIWKGQPNYPNDLNACARDLTREGWRFSIKQWIEVGKPDTWLAEYYNNQLARGVGHWGDTPAVAWCESFLALCAYVEGKGGEGR